jgi:hypothetical protein
MIYVHIIVRNLLMFFVDFSKPYFEESMRCVDFSTRLKLPPVLPQYGQ